MGGMGHALVFRDCWGFKYIIAIIYWIRRGYLRNNTTKQWDLNGRSRRRMRTTSKCAPKGEIPRQEIGKKVQEEVETENRSRGRKARKQGTNCC
jgi:hypothetical protein